MANDCDILKLTPSFFEKVWGGKRIGKVKGLSSDSSFGESWEVSILPEGNSFVERTSLSELIQVDRLPYMVKLIDTSDNLSIQVHPTTEYAKTHHNSSGKSECWLILESEEGSGIYLGFKDGVCRDSLTLALNEKKDISKFLNFIPVKKGDFFNVPAGSVHAIGKDVFLVEIQESCGITYRLWDWDRVGLDGKLRELHIDHALNVLNFDFQFNKNLSSNFPYNTFEKSETTLLEHSSFKVSSFTLKSKEKIDLLPTTFERYRALIVIEGSGEIKDHLKIKSFESYLFKKNNKIKVINSSKKFSLTFLLVE